VPDHPRRPNGGGRLGLEENKAVVQRLVDAINSGNLDELPQVGAPDVVDPNAGRCR
jgi:hypothetical protein